MISANALRKRFMKDSLPSKWGGIASDLLRLSGIVHAEKTLSPTFQVVLNETKLFTEWIARDVELPSQKTVLKLQRSLSKWSAAGSRDFIKIEKDAQKWSQKILSLSGLK